MKKFLKKDNFILIGCIFIILMLIHFPLLTKNIVGADILLNNYFYNGFSWEISLGRFGLYIIGIIKGFLSFPHLDLFISFFLISISVFLIIDLFNIEGIISKILCILLFSLSPIISATLLFHYCAIGYFMAFFLGILSVYIFFKAKKKYLKYLIPLLLIIISLSMYQAYFSFIISFFVIYNLYLLIKNKINYKEVFKYLLTLLGGVILYFILMKISQAVFHIDMSNYSNADKVGLATLFNFPTKIIDAYGLFYKFFFTNEIMKNTYFYNNIINFLLLIIMFISIIISMIRNKVSKLNIIIGIFLTILLPVFLNSVIFVISDSKLQLLMSASYLLIFLFIIILSNEKYIKLVSYILLILLFRNYLIQDQASYMSIENIFIKYNTIIGTSLSQNINDLDKEFVIIGTIKDKYSSDLDNIYNSNYGFICDEDIFWDEYNLRKIAFERFVYEYYGLKVRFADLETYNYILNNRNTSDILYEINDINVIDFYNY